MASILLIFLCLFIGYLLKRFEVVDINGFKILNILIIYVALPALTLHYIPRIEVDSTLVYPILMPWLNILLSWVVFGLIGCRFGWGKTLTGAVILMAGFGNTSFVGIPIIQGLFGEEGIKTVIMVDQPGSFVALTTLGILIANIYSSKQKSTIYTVISNILKFPPFIAFVIGIALNLTSYTFPSVLDEMFITLGGLVVPLALISVGMQLRLDLKSVYWRYVWLGLGFKLVLFPAFIFVLYFLIFNQNGTIIEITWIESAMAPMITAGIVASGYGLKPNYCSLMLSVGLILSFITIGIWYSLLSVFPI
ncbi:AEC family transporter [Flavobacteriaceae bacterium Ap0902]|nr:AEC family transporter [Flavobacteriaceae bacterium Ap0902]